MALSGGLVLAGPAAAAKHEFDMTIEDVYIEVADGLKYHTFAFNGQVPGPLIHVQEGDDITVNVTNLTALPHTIHWHGILQKGTWQMDGVPAITQKPIEPGDSFTYKFVADPTGTLWYHCHVNVNEHVAIRGMWGPLIVDPKKPTELEKKVTKDFILMLSTYDSKYANKPGFGGHPTEEGDMDYFGLNGRAFPNTQPMRIEEGDVVRVRLYGAGGGIHEMHTHGHSFKVTHKDGYPLPEPYMADTVMVGPGERYDLIFEADNPGRFIFHDHMDTHVTNAGKYPGGIVTIMEYDGIPKEDWYAWKNKDFNPDFFFTESLRKPHGMIGQDGFKGEPVEKKRRGRK
ncbi:MAG: multicopper oxidase domain-containing protein [Leptospirillia bacterium]